MHALASTDPAVDATLASYTGSSRITPTSGRTERQNNNDPRFGENFECESVPKVPSDLRSRKYPGETEWSRGELPSGDGVMASTMSSCCCIFLQNPSQACSNSPQRNLTIESLSLLNLHSLFHGRSIGRWTVHLSSTPVVLAPGGIQQTVQEYAVKLLSRHSPTRVCLFIHEPRCAIVLHHHHEGIQANRGTSPTPNMPWSE